MKLVVKDDELRIEPEGSSDKAFIVHVLGLGEADSTCRAARFDVQLGFHTSEMACIRLTKHRDRRTRKGGGK